MASIDEHGKEEGMERSVVTLNRFILEEERRHPEATGRFSHLLQDFTLAVKLVHRAVGRAGLVDILGREGRENVHGEEVRKLDQYAHDVIFRAMDHGGHLCLMASEEAGEPLRVPERFPTGEYVLLFDPLDGSGNIDTGITVGTIFSVYRRISQGRDGTMDDLLQPLHQQVAAGYVVYGSSTILVYTTGNGVHGFTLDPSIGEFILSHEEIRLPATSGESAYGANEAYAPRWNQGLRLLVADLKEEGLTQRWVGSAVADFHRTLLRGGLFMYPAHAGAPEGKLRLMYEVAPLAMVCEQAGGAATDGRGRILDRRPERLHQRTPAFFGHPELVERAGRHVAGGD